MNLASVEAGFGLLDLNLLVTRPFFCHPPVVLVAVFIFFGGLEGLERGLQLGVIIERLLDLA